MDSYRPIAIHRKPKTAEGEVKVAVVFVEIFSAIAFAIPSSLETSYGTTDKGVFVIVTGNVTEDVIVEALSFPPWLKVARGEHIYLP